VKRTDIRSDVPPITFQVKPARGGKCLFFKLLAEF
jgi:hypothetical protein